MGIVGLVYFLLRPLYLHYQLLQHEYSALVGNSKRYSKTEISDSVYYALPDVESPALEKRIPVDGNHPEFVVQIDQAVRNSKATLVKMQLAETYDSFLPADQAKAGKSQTSDLQTGMENEKNPFLQPVWIRLEVAATKEEWIRLIDELQKGDRLISVTVWKYQWTDEKKPATGTIYLTAYYYQDSRLKKGK
ncbi:hypothetical protein H2C83_10780 [Thermoactinomyces sp. AMNI-1]|uniref:Uncharacterized protein n=2 Tax=Thermoactinomyces mirandus TaxID=2756294 RepID=A0A7W1XT53_9BACL|nr:hypothetical protein [Thermoactinomyces mirandus]